MSTGSLRYRLARAHDLAGNLPTALALYERLLAEGAGSADSLQLARGRLLARLGRDRRSDRRVSRGLGGPRSMPPPVSAPADLHFAAQRYNRAWSLYWTPDRQRRGRGWSDIGRAVVCLFELGRTKEAKRPGQAAPQALR